MANAIRELARAPVVSIGLPVYNGGRFLRGAIRALLSQDYSNFELIISDNASTDDTATICSEFAAQDERVRFYWNTRNFGPVANFKRVYHLARGRFFMWAAHDDLWDPQFLSELLKPLLADDRCVASFCNFILTNRNRNDEVSLPGGMPKLSLGNNSFENFSELLVFPQAPLFYGLFRKEILSRTATLSDEFFDWSDMFTLAQIVTFGAVTITDKILFRCGIMADRRPPKSFAKQKPAWFHYGYYPYTSKMIRLIMQHRGFKGSEKGRLLLLLAAQICSFVRGLEPIPRPIGFVMEAVESLIQHGEHRYFRRYLGGAPKTSPLRVC